MHMLCFADAMYACSSHAFALSTIPNTYPAPIAQPVATPPRRISTSHDGFMCTFHAGITSSMHVYDTCARPMPWSTERYTPALPPQHAVWRQIHADALRVMHAHIPHMHVPFMTHEVVHAYVASDVAVSWDSDTAAIMSKSHVELIHDVKRYAAT